MLDIALENVKKVVCNANYVVSRCGMQGIVKTSYEIDEGGECEWNENKM